MVDASRLLEALSRDEINQRDVGSFLFLLAKGLKNKAAPAAAGRTSTYPPPYVSASESTVEAAIPRGEGEALTATGNSSVSAATQTTPLQQPRDRNFQHDEVESRQQAQSLEGTASQQSGDKDIKHDETESDLLRQSSEEIPSHQAAETVQHNQAEHRKQEKSSEEEVPRWQSEGDFEHQDIGSGHQEKTSEDMHRFQSGDALVQSGDAPTEEGEVQEKMEPDSGAPQSLEKVQDRPEARGDLLLQLICSFRNWAMHRVDSILRSKMLRVVRLLVRTSEDAEVIRKQRFGLFIALALVRGQREVWERMQALKLVKKIMAVDSSRLPREVVRTMVAVSAHKEDSFRKVSLEALLELAVDNPRMVAYANGFRVLLAAAIDPAIQELTERLVTALMAIIEDPATRRYLRPHIELHQLLTGFTDLDAPPGHEREHLWKVTRKALVVAMRSWAGVYLLGSDSRGLVTLMRLLRDPSASFSGESGLQANILETVIDVFRPLMGIIRGNTTTIAQKRPGSRSRARKGSGPHDVLLSYATMLCAAFVHCGLIPSLTTLSISAGSKALRSKAEGLLVDVLQLCAILLSQNQCTRLLSMPGLVQIAAESQAGSMATAEEGAWLCHSTRSRALRAGDLIRRLHGALGAGAGDPVTAYMRQETYRKKYMVTIGGLMQKVYEADLCIDSVDTNQDREREPTGTLEQMRRELRQSIESTVEKSMMENQFNKSKVLANKDWTKWDWDVVDDIVQDTLSHPPRLVDALRTKWIKRVSGFYRFVGSGDSDSSTERGGGGGLHNITWGPDQIRHISRAGRLYYILLQQQEGVHFLQTDSRGGIIQEIIKELQALVTRRCCTTTGVPGKLAGISKVFDMETCQRRLSGSYVTLLFGVAAKTEAGQRILQNEGFLNNLVGMGRQPELDYISRLVLTKIDLNPGSFIPRELLKDWMTTGSSHLRLFALSLVRIALGGASAGGRKAENSSLSAHTATTTPDDAPLEDWCIAALVEQLNGDDAAVARAALSVLEEATHDERCLRTLVLAKPDLIDRPGASNLLMRFLSLPEGIEYLENLGWVDRIVREWNEKGRTTTYASSLDATWKTFVNEVEHAEGKLIVEPLTEFKEKARSKSGVAIPIKTSNIPSFLSQAGAIGGPWGGREMQLLLSLPWNIEVIVSKDSGLADEEMTMRVDTFVDASTGGAAPSTRATGAGSPGATMLVVRGILVDQAGTPTCYPVETRQTLRARLCVGACAVDRKGGVHWDSDLLTNNRTQAQMSEARVDRPSQDPRLQVSPHYGLADWRGDGASTVYHGEHDEPEDSPENGLWSICRPDQREAQPPVSNIGCDNGKDMGRPGTGMRPISAGWPNTFTSESLDTEDRDSFVPSGDTSTVGRGDDDAGASTKDSAGVGTGNEKQARVVQVPMETARWVFSNQPQPENATSMQVVESSSFMYLKAVEVTISLEDMGNIRSSALHLQPHLYGELAKTEKGCEVLQKHGDLKKLLHTARNSNASTNDRKGALWAVAHVSSSPPGLALLEGLQGDFISILLSMCTSESHLSVWGTLFCAVSLVARTARGRAAIRAAGWESARDPITSIFLPQDPTILFQPVPWTFEGSLTQGLHEQQIDPVIERCWHNLPTEDAAILHQVAKLSSHISRKEALKMLSRMRKARKESFTNSLPVLLLVHQLLADYSFSLPMRRHIFDLFGQVTSGNIDWEPYVT